MRKSFLTILAALMLTALAGAAFAGAHASPPARAAVPLELTAPDAAAGARDRSEGAEPAYRAAPGAVVDRTDREAEMRDNAQVLAWHDQQNQPQRAFEAAREAYRAGNKQQVERHLRLTADAMRGEVLPNDHSREANAVRLAARGIVQLATRLTLGESGPASPFNGPFAAAYRALADYDYAVARHTWQTRNLPSGPGIVAGLGMTPPATAKLSPDAALLASGRAQLVSNYLQASADNLNNWSRETGQILSEPGQAALDSMVGLTARMRGNTDWTDGQVAENLDRYGAIFGFEAR